LAHRTQAGKGGERDGERDGSRRDVDHVRASIASWANPIVTLTRGAGTADAAVIRSAVMDIATGSRLSGFG
jgi:hypothetical protein